MIHPMKDARTDLKGMSLGELEAFFRTRGKERYRARQVSRWIYQKVAEEFSAMTDLSRGFREELMATCRISSPAAEIMELSRDGTEKFLFRLEDGEAVESVLIPEENRRTLCVSTQAGCALSCVFCATGASGFRRNMTSAEIIHQVCFAARRLAERGERLTNVVFMGTGGPVSGELRRVAQRGQRRGTLTPYACRPEIPAAGGGRRDAGNPPPERPQGDRGGRPPFRGERFPRRRAFSGAPVVGNPRQGQPDLLQPASPREFPFPFPGVSRPLPRRPHERGNPDHHPGKKRSGHPRRLRTTDRRLQGPAGPRENRLPGKGRTEKPLSPGNLLLILVKMESPEGSGKGPCRIFSVLSAVPACTRWRE